MSDDITPILLDDDAWIDDALLEEQWLAAEMAKRPKTRAECIDGPRPCPWYSCRYHLGLNISSCGTRVMVSTEPEDLDESTETCSLDVANRGPLTLEEVGQMDGGVSRERIRQIEQQAFGSLEVNTQLAALINVQPRAEPAPAESPTPEEAAKPKRKRAKRRKETPQEKFRRVSLTEEAREARELIYQHVVRLAEEAGSAAALGRRVGMSRERIHLVLRGHALSVREDAERLGVLDLMRPIVVERYAGTRLEALAWRAWVVGSSINQIGREPGMYWVREGKRRRAASRDQIRQLTARVRQLEAAA